MSAGRPLKFKTVEELQTKVKEYFETCDEKGKPYTITGLALSLDTTRQGLMNYQERDEFYDTIKKAKLQCENYAEEQLFVGKNTAGVIFNMKNNYGWVDKQEIEQSGETTHNIKHNTNLDNLSVEELMQLESILSKSTNA
jgi:hypothetical protein